MRRQVRTSNDANPIFDTISAKKSRWNAPTTVPRVKTSPAICIKRNNRTAGVGGHNRYIQIEPAKTTTINKVPRPKWRFFNRPLSVYTYVLRSTKSTTEQYDVSSDRSRRVLWSSTVQ